MAFDFLKKQDINKGIAEFNDTNNAVLLDVRTAEEYKEGHISGSKNISYEKVDTVESLITDKTTPIFVYCHSGSRSRIAVNKLRSIGYTDVKNIGGIVSYTGITEGGL